MIESISDRVVGSESCCSAFTSASIDSDKRQLTFFKKSKACRQRDPPPYMPVTHLHSIVVFELVWMDHERLLTVLLLDLGVGSAKG